MYDYHNTPPIHYAEALEHAEENDYFRFTKARA